MAETIQFFVPVVGRFISGDLMEKRKTDHERKPIPEEKQQYEIGVAFDKAAIWPWLTTEFFQKVMQATAHDRSAQPRAQAWFGSLNGFAMKIADGDTPNAKGQVNENTKGCFVFYFKSSYQPSCVIGSIGAFVDITPDRIKRGDYVSMSGTIKANDKTGGQMGIYMNMSHVWLQGEGDAIVGGGDPNDAFAGAGQFALPAGARPLGAASGAPAAFGAPPAQPQYAPPPAQPQYAPPPAAAPAGFTPAAAPAPMGHAPQQAPAFAPPPAAPTTVSPGNAPMMPTQPPAAPHYAPLQMPPGVAQ